MKQSLPPSTYDGIILFQCLEQVYRHSLSFIHLCRRALKDDGQLIIIHRDVNSQTLPLPSEVFPPWSNKSSQLLRKLLEHLQRHQRHSIDFFQEIRSIKFTMRKIHWFSLLYHRTFYPLTLIEQNKVIFSDSLAFLRSSIDLDRRRFTTFERNILQISLGSDGNVRSIGFSQHSQSK